MHQFVLMLSLLVSTIAVAEEVEPLRLTVTPRVAEAVPDEWSLVPVRDVPGSNAAAAWLRPSVWLAGRESGIDEIDDLWEADQQTILDVLDEQAEEMAHDAVRSGSVDRGIAVPRIETLLPELTHVRTLARLQSAEAVLAVRDGVVLQDQGLGKGQAVEVDDIDAIVAAVASTVRIRAALHADLQKYPALVGALTGAHICYTAYEDLARLLERPDAPNLYHALSVSEPASAPLRRLIELERAGILASLPGFKRVSTGGTIEPAELRELIELLKTFGFIIGNEVRDVDPPNMLEVLAWGGTWHVRNGTPMEEIRVMSAAQRAATAMLAEFDAFFDQQIAAIDQLSPQITAMRLGIAWLEFADKRQRNLLLWTTSNLSRSPMALHGPHRLHAMLLAVEAVRHHVAVHGQLPANLYDCDLEVPLDPVTSLPFVFEPIDGGFKLSPWPLPDAGPVRLNNEWLAHAILVTLRQPTE